MSAPLVSVIIPTHNRPALLPKAVRSALAHSGDSVEIVVVPNGGDESYRYSLREFESDSRVRVESIPKANGNAARNHGMSIARGKYIRFLDDDDYLLPTARKQIDLLEISGAEICSGSVEKVDESGRATGHMQQRDSKDLLCAMLRPYRVCLPIAHVFLRSALGSMKWDESLTWDQDTEWMLRLSSFREWNWILIDDAVGCWIQHNGPRTSNNVGRLARARFNSNLFLDSLKHVQARGAMTATRADAFSEVFWSLAHHHFHKSPVFFTAIAKVAMRLNPERAPPDPFYQSGVARKINPILIEYLLIPRRIFKDWDPFK